jgi:hypothetical protein
MIVVFFICNNKMPHKKSKQRSKKQKSKSKDIGSIALYFTYVRDKMKFYHWSTKSFARHSASDKFVSSLSDKMDRFIEVMQGSEGQRIVLPSKSKYSFNNETDESIVKVLKKFRDWLSNDLPSYIKTSDTDLLNIRDDILGDVNNTLYLFDFK